MLGEPNDGATDADAARDGATPAFPRARALDTAWYRAERVICGLMFLAMALLVFAAVVRDIFGTRHSLADGVVVFGFVLAALRTRVLKGDEQRASWPRSAALAAAITVALAVVVEVYVEAMPGGFVWAPKMALCLMLWVGFFGASIATYEKAHLALEFGEKVWPRALLPAVKALAHAITSAFCLALFALSIYSVREHYAAWDAAAGYADYVPSMPWLPQWAVYVVFPYVFLAMSIRLLAQTYTVARGIDEAPIEQMPT